MYHVRNALRILLIVTLLAACVWAVSATTWIVATEAKPLVVSGFNSPQKITDGVTTTYADKASPLGFAASQVFKGMSPAYVRVAGPPAGWLVGSLKKVNNNAIAAWDMYIGATGAYDPGVKTFQWAVPAMCLAGPIPQGTIIGGNENTATPGWTSPWGATPRWLIMKYEGVAPLNVWATVPIHVVAAAYRTGYGSFTIKCTAKSDPNLALIADAGAVTIDGAAGAGTLNGFILATDGKSSVSTYQEAGPLSAPTVQAGTHSYTYTDAGAAYTVAAGTFTLKDAKVTSVSCKIRAI